MPDKTILLLGGAGLVGAQVAWQISCDISPEKVVIASLYQREVREAIELLEREFPNIEYVGVWGDVFARADFTHERRAALLASAKRRADLFDDLLGDLDRAYARSRLVQLIREHKPDVIVDSINTATAISYQDVYTASIIAKQKMDALFARIAALEQMARSPSSPLTPLPPSPSPGLEVQSRRGGRGLGDEGEVQELARLRKSAQQAFDALVLSQAVPQLIRHAILVLRAMQEVGTRLYLKIGTTGTGGMWLNIPYTHGEDKPSARLMSKTAVAFAHTGLMFLMARTTGAPIVKEIKPAAMIGYADITMRAIAEHGEPVYVYDSKNELLDESLVLRDDSAKYAKLGKLKMVVVDTGENGLFTKGEFEAISAMRQMEFITPEEIAAKVVLEIKGQNTGSDVIAAIDGAVLDPTYRAGYLRRSALEEIERLEQETGVPSVALGQLGPPESGKLLYEAFLLKQRYRTLDTVLKQRPKKIADALYRYVLKHDDMRRTITSIGLPILAPDGSHIIRGPFIRIPERADTNRVPLTPDDIDKYARKGWVDLRPENMARWKERFEKMQRAQQQIRGRGSAAITMEAYLQEEIRIGDVVAWVFNNEEIGYRIK
ncbi:MAG: hypothetical protein HY782_07720 [Chloroflexi bacterium]|nr:hypothetical protein [Chloroflexota bacterium]